MELVNNRDKSSFFSQILGTTAILFFLYPVLFYFTKVELKREPDEIIFNIIFGIVVVLGILMQLFSKKIKSIVFDDHTREIEIRNLRLFGKIEKKKYSYESLKFTKYKYTLKTEVIGIYSNSRLVCKILENDFGQEGFMKIRDKLSCICT